MICYPTAAFLIPNQDSTAVVKQGSYTITPSTQLNMFIIILRELILCLLFHVVGFVMPALYLGHATIQSIGREL